jgi:hypothetical protein
MIIYPIHGFFLPGPAAVMLRCLTLKGRRRAGNHPAIPEPVKRKPSGKTLSYFISQPSVPGKPAAFFSPTIVKTHK